MHLSASVPLALASLATATLAQGGPWQVGEPLPHVHLPTIDGEELDLAELRGTKLLLVEFASW